MRAAAIVVALLLLVPARASAHMVYATECDGTALPVDVFATSDTVCLTGDVDFTCPVGPFINLPAADLYVVMSGGNPLSAPPVHFETLGGFGSFLDIVVMLPPLAPGFYDVLLDEHCDGMITGDDLIVAMAFRVGGTLTCDMPPGQPIDPGLPSGARCRGACGRDCPSSCTPAASLDVCVEDAAACEHMTCSYDGVVCGTHAGCRTHDACYDACAAAGASFLCWRQCDLDCLTTYGLPCASWARGGGPYDGTLTFYQQTSSSGPSPGRCAGGGC